jgi:hypothetical protein
MTSRDRSSDDCYASAVLMNVLVNFPKVHDTQWFLFCYLAVREKLQSTVARLMHRTIKAGGARQAPRREAAPEHYLCVVKGAAIMADRINAVLAAGGDDFGSRSSCMRSSAHRPSRIAPSE